MKLNKSSSWFVSLLVILSALVALTLTGSSYTNAKEREDVDENRDRDRDARKKDDGTVCADLPPAVRNAIEHRFGKQCPRAGSSSGIAKGDFNADGFADLAIGVPNEETPAGVRRSGAVIVIYGSVNGLTVTDGAVPAPQFWSQNTEGVPDRSEIGDTFGSAVASGDFNGDGFSDLAIGVPGDIVVRNNQGNTGQVIVIFGSAAGLTTAPTAAHVPQRFTICELPGAQARIAICNLAAQFESDVSGLGGNFGLSLAWGDFDGDGFGDLAVGSPDEDLTSVAHGGAVAILFGSRDGLSAARGQLLTLDNPDLPGPARAGDRFGAALAAGDFNADTVSDLAIGISDKDIPGTDTQGGVTIVDAGAVLVLLGRARDGLTSAGQRLIDENDLFLTADTPGVAATGDRLGSALAVGDFDGNGRDDLAIGAHHRLVRGQFAAGAVFVLYSSSSSPLGGPVQFWEQSKIFPGSSENSELNAVGSPTEAGDHFGWSLAAGDFNGDGRDDLAIGVPFETLLVNRGNNTFVHVTSAGEVDVIYGSRVGLSISASRAPQRITRSSVAAQSGDMLGWSLTAWNFGKDEQRQVCSPTTPPLCFTLAVKTTDLAIGVPGQDVGNVAGAGAVKVFYGSVAGNGLTFSNNQEWTHSNTGTGTSQAGEFFGGALY